MKTQDIRSVISIARHAGLVCTLLAGSTAPFAAEPPARPDSDPPNAEVVTLPEFTVTTDQEQGYLVPTVISGSRAGERLTETTFSVQSLTNEFMNDFQLFEMADQLRYIAGAFSGAEDTGANNGKTIRGFGPPTLRDGFASGGGGANPPNRATVDRVEVIRGPVSTLYGAAGPGGLINYVTKRGKRDPYYHGTATFGNYGFERYAFEATGPLVRDKAYYYAIYAHDYTESDLEYFFTKKDLYAFGFTYVLSSQTSFTASYEKQHATSNQGDTIPLLQVTGPTRTIGIFWDLATFNIMGPYNKLARDFEGGNLLFEHRFARNLIGRINLRTYDKDFVENQYRYGSGNVLQVGGTMTAEAYRQDQDIAGHQGQADLRLTLDGGAIKHTLLGAVDASWEEVRNITFVAPPTNMVVGGTTVYRRPTYVINPVSPVWPRIPDADISQVFQDSDRSIYSYGAFAGHRMSLLGNKLITMAGVRYDRIDDDRLKTLAATAVVSTNNQTPRITTNDASGSSDEAFSYTVGATYKLRGESLVAYVNHSTGFEPTVAIDTGTFAVVPNESSSGVEAGFKGAMYGDNLLWTASVFQIRKNDVAISNPDFSSAALPGTPQYILGGKEEANGVELDLRWNVDRNLYFQVGGAFIDAKVTEPEASRDRIAKAPRYSGYAATRYVFTEAPLQGLRIGASVSYTGDYLYNRGSATRFRQLHPAATLYNGFVGYGWRMGKKFKHSAQANVQNAADESYLQDTFRVARGREVRFTYTLSY